jgi:branched-chain amino acid transport system ATP-binding protein
VRAPDPLLAVDDVKSGYGRVAALKGVTLSIREGEIVCLVGGNGAGKTTLLRAVSGVQPIWSGRVAFRGDDITRLAPHRLVAKGIAQVPEGRQVFTPLTIEDNLRLGAFRRGGADVEGTLDEVFALFPILKEKRRLAAGGLSGGQQQMLAIGRAMISKPQLLLLDEPSMGLAPILVDQILEAITGLKRRGVTVLLVEQNAVAALSIADRGYVIETGAITHEGPAGDLLADDKVREAYLGL